MTSIPTIKNIFTSIQHLNNGNDDGDEEKGLYHLYTDNRYIFNNHPENENTISLPPRRYNNDGESSSSEENPWIFKKTQTLGDFSYDSEDSCDCVYHDCKNKGKCYCLLDEDVRKIIMNKIKRRLSF